MKFILLISLVVLTFTTATKLKCSEVSESPATVTKTTTKCPRVTCRNRYIWLEEACKCICPPIYCPVGTIHGSDCDCIPETTQGPTDTTETTSEPTTTSPAVTEITPCPRKDCRNRYVWFPEGCECICPPMACEKGTYRGNDCDCIPDITTSTETTLDTTDITPCPREDCRNRYVWLQEACQCVCPPMYCPEGTIHGSDCDCIPETTPGPTETTPELCEPIVPCQRSWFWNYETCACQLGCDYIRIDCPQGTKWDIFACDCIEACPGVVCDVNMVPDSETCICVPIDVTDTSPETTLPECSDVVCKDGYYVDPSTCYCVPIDPTGSTPLYCPDYCQVSYDGNGEAYCACGWGCDYIMECPLGEKWDFGVCGCIFDPDYVPACLPCEGASILNETTCECVCPLTAADCPDPSTELDPYRCMCFNRGCDPYLSCSVGEIVSWEVCGCIPDPNYQTTTCPPCDGNNVPNPVNCQCECPLTEADCAGPLSEFDPFMCTCLRHPCDPPFPCPTGEMISWETCSCVPDPNYETTPCPQCYGNNVLNTTTCDCVCEMTDEDCPGPRSELRFDICECVMHPCDPPYPCPKGQIIDWEICNCVDDPNATTSKPTKKPKDSESKESKDSSEKSSSKSKESSENSDSSSKKTSSPSAEPQCDSCNCNGKKDLGTKPPCTCPGMTKVRVSKDSENVCCVSETKDGWTWPPPCRGVTLNDKTAREFPCDDKVEKNCGQCSKGEYQSHKIGTSNFCCCNQSPLPLDFYP